LSAPQSRTGRERNHSHGYFDRPLSGTPRKTRPSPALLSLPEEHSPTRGGDPIKGMPSLFEKFTAQGVTRTSSESSDLSAVSDSSSRSTPLTTPGSGTPDDKPSLNDSYSQFLNQFCFFTGSNSLMNHTPSSITRSHSASDVEAFFSPHHFSSPLRDPAFNGPRSSSFDNIAASHTHRGKSMLASAA